MVQNLKEILWDDENVEIWMGLLVPDNDTFLIEGSWWNFLVKIGLFNVFIIAIRFLIVRDQPAIWEFIILLILNFVVVGLYLLYFKFLNSIVKRLSISGVFLALALIFAVIVII
jgi:hypothetical protein